MTHTVIETAGGPETSGPQSSNTAVWVRATRIAALTIAFWSVALHVTAAVFIPPVASIGLVFGVLAIFLKGERRGLALVTAVLGLVTLVGNLPGTIDELSHPSSAPAFILTLLVVIGAVAVVIAGVAAFQDWATTGIKPLATISLALFAVGALGALSAASAVDSVEALETDIKMTTQGLSFDPTELVVPAGTSGFWIDNRDGIRHTFTIESLGLEIDVPANSSQRSDLELAPGQYQVICAVPSHENMTMNLTVER